MTIEEADSLLLAQEKFENYMKKDEEMEAEGKEYGGLM